MTETRLQSPKLAVGESKLLGCSRRFPQLVCSNGARTDCARQGTTPRTLPYHPVYGQAGAAAVAALRAARTTVRRRQHSATAERPACVKGIFAIQRCETPAAAHGLDGPPNEVIHHGLRPGGLFQMNKCLCVRRGDIRPKGRRHRSFDEICRLLRSSLSYARGFGRNTSCAGRYAPGLDAAGARHSSPLPFSC